MANVAVVQAFITAFGCGEAETALGQLHGDAQVSEPASMPIGGEYAGNAGFVGFLATVAATYDVKIHRAKVMDAGDMPMARLELTRTAHSTGASLDTRRQRDAASVIGRLE